MKAYPLILTGRVLRIKTNDVILANSEKIKCYESVGHALF